MRDKLFILSDAQALTDDGASTVQFDFESASPGIGDDLKLNVAVNTAFSGGSVTKCAIHLQDSADDDTYNTVLQSAPLVVTAVGTVLQVALPKTPKLRRYFRLNYVFFQDDGTTTGNPTAGKFDAWLGLDAPDA